MAEQSLRGRGQAQRAARQLDIQDKHEQFKLNTQVGRLALIYDHSLSCTCFEIALLIMATLDPGSDIQQQCIMLVLESRVWRVAQESDVLFANIAEFTAFSHPLGDLVMRPDLIC